MQVMPHAKHGPFKMPGWPVRVDGATSKLKSSPMLGEHNAEVLGKWLGMNQVAVDALKSEGVI